MGQEISCSLTQYPEDRQPLLKGYSDQKNSLNLSLNGVGVCSQNILVAQLCPTLCNPMDCSLPGSSTHGIFSGKNTGMGCHFLFQGIFLTQGSNLGLLCCRQTLLLSEQALIK